MKSKIIRVNTSDNVAVALVNLKAGEVISFEGKEITVLSDIKSKHKIALQKFESGDRIVMYSVLVGSANGVIEKGGALTTENVKHQSEKVFGKTETIGWTAPNVEKWKDTNSCSTPHSSGNSDRMAVPFKAANKSETAPKVGLADIPEKPSDPPHSKPTRSLDNGAGLRSALLAFLMASKDSLTMADNISSTVPICCCSKIRTGLFRLGLMLFNASLKTLI